MARPLRVEFPGAHYHVTNRGNQRAVVYRNAGDYERFLEKLEQFVKSFGVRVFCYCLMPNHFHLYLRTAESNLSRFMQSLLTSFTVSLNRSRRTSGHVFQGRFKAQLVEEEGYHAALSRYIHLNPVRVAAFRNRPIAEQRKHLRRFRWSSYPAFIGVRKPPGWLAVDQVLADWSGRRAERMKRYRRYVEKGLLGDLASPCAGAAEQSIVGSDGFVDRIRRAYLAGRQPDRREQPSLVHLQQSFSVDEVVTAVAEVFDADPRRLLARRGDPPEARRIAMYLASKHCRGTTSLTQVAEGFSVSVSGLTRARDRVETALRNNRKLRRVVKHTQKRLGLDVKSIA